MINTLLQLLNKWCLKYTTWYWRRGCNKIYKKRAGRWTECGWKDDEPKL